MRMTILRKLAILLVCMVILPLAVGGCGTTQERPVPPTTYPEAVEFRRLTTALRRYIDWETGVVCYRTPEGISCLPLDETWVGAPGMAQKTFEGRRSRWEERPVMGVE